MNAHEYKGSLLYVSARDKTGDHAALKERVLRVVQAPDGDLLWESLQEHGAVKDYFSDLPHDGEAESWSNFEKKARQLVRDQRRFQEKHAGRHAPREEILVAVSGHDERMAQAYSALLARQAAADPVVKRFRERRLKGKTLAPNEAKEYMLYNARRSLIRGLSAVTGKPPTKLDTRSIEEVSQLWQKSGFGAPLIVGEAMLARTAEDPTLGDVASYLTERYPWGEEAAAWFVLTGETPAIEPLKLMWDPNKDTYILEFRPWTSKAALGQAYRAIHRERSNRPVESGTLALLAFVDEHTDEHGNRPRTWDELRRLWNARGLGRHYEDYRTFSKVYRRAYEKLAPRRF